MEDAEYVTEFDPDFSSCSVESLLNVPMHVIFREAKTVDRGSKGGGGGGAGGSGNQKSFILSKSEVSTLLRVSMLSSELDAILSLASDALDKSQRCKAYRKRIIESNEDPASANAGGILLRALLPIVAVHSDTAEEALEHATRERFGIGRVLSQLEECAVDLEKCAEQNHNMADQLDCYMAPGDTSVLSNEKRAMAEMEEAIAERIEGLNSLAATAPSAAVAVAIRSDEAPAADELNKVADDFIPMSELCERLFAKYHLSSDVAPPPRAEARGHFTESQKDAAAALRFMSSTESQQDAVQALRFMSSDSRGGK